MKKVLALVAFAGFITFGTSTAVFAQDDAVEDIIEAVDSMAVDSLQDIAPPPLNTKPTFGVFSCVSFCAFADNVPSMNRVNMIAILFKLYLYSFTIKVLCHFQNSKIYRS